MIGDYKNPSDDKHYERIKDMQDKMVNLLTQKRGYEKFTKSKNHGSDVRCGARFSRDKTENEIDELLKEMRQQ